MSYGTLPLVPAWVDLDEKSINLDRLNTEEEWITTIPYSAWEATMMVGAITDNTPIDVIHWTGDGHIQPDGMEWWNDCLSLMVHI